jgi:hypothetical protein
MDSSLFMTNQDLFEWGMLEFVKEREDNSARVIEKKIHPFLL